jgi:hypothetical protein
MVKKNRSKLNVDNTEKGKEKRTVNGIVFASEIEARYYKEIILSGMESGAITAVALHPKYILQEAFEKYGRKFQAVYYEADFQILYQSNDIEIIDVKGMPTEAALLKRKWFDKRHHDKILRWVAYSKQDGGWIEFDDLKKLRAKRKKSKKKSTFEGQEWD